MHLKKTIALIVAIAMLSVPATSINAQDYSYTGGSGYLEYRSAPNVTTSVALSVLALGAIVAVAIQHSHHDHAHTE